MSDLFLVFDAWEPLLKARKAKGLDQWAKLQPLAEQLAGKGVSAISFTCCHPSHGGEPVKHLLGSVEGNLHFMLGYGNPSFHVAPYHWRVIDPNTTPEEAQETFSRIGNPANPSLWARSGLATVGDEGDTSEGEAHTSAKQAKAKAQKDTAKAAESVPAKSPTGTYTCIPSEGLIYGDHNQHVYRWDLVKDSFFSAFNPEATEAMNAVSIQKSQNMVRFRPTVPDAIRLEARKYRGESFDTNVFYLIKSRCPAPGSVVTLESTQGESAYAVITPSSIDFYGRDGQSTEVKVFDRVYKSFDVTPQGNVPPAALLGFVVKTFGVNASLLAEVATPPKGERLIKSDISIEGEPTPGFEDVSADYAEGLNKSIAYDGDAIRVVVTQ